MYVGHKNTNLQNVPPTFCKFMSGHNFDISFHLPPQRAVARHGEEPHAAAARRRRRRRRRLCRHRCPSITPLSIAPPPFIAIVPAVHCDRRCHPSRATSHFAASSSALASAWALTLGVGVGHCRRRRDAHGTGRLRLVCIVVGEGGWRRQCVAALSGCLCIGGGGERGRQSRQRWACRGVVGAAAEQRPQGDIVGVGGGQRACCGAGGAAVGRRQGVGGGEG